MNRTLVIVGGGILVVVIGIAIFLRVRTASNASTTNAITGTSLPDALKPLRQNTDLTTGRSFLHQVNAYLEENPTQRPQALSAETTTSYRSELGLSTAEFNELNSIVFTPLDAHHLEFCFLMREAGDKLPGQAPEAKQLSKLDKATLAFAWTMRQVRLKRTAREEGEGWLLAMLGRERLPEEEDLELENVATWGSLVLRRGTGSPLERSLLFLALLDQLGLDGCLVSDGDERRPQYWACGVLGDDNQLYLFDPRMGMPLPGPDGKGIATLADVQRDPKVLGQLTFPDKQQYDISLEGAGKAELHLVCTLSALSPRMKYLQDAVLAPSIKVNLTDDPVSTRTKFSKVQMGNGKTVVVRHARWAPGLLRRALPPAEGGTDRGSRREILLMRLAPVGNLLVLLPPEVLRDIRDIRSLITPPLSQPVGMFQQVYIQPMIEPRKPRDLVLRGRLEEAIRELGTFGERIDHEQAQFREVFDQKKLGEWYDKALRISAMKDRAERENKRDVVQEANAQLEQLWREYEKPLTALILGSMYGARKAQAVYWRTLALHDQAERAHARVVTGGASDEHRARHFEEAQRLWSEVAGWWQSFGNDFAGVPDAPAARLARARALRGLAEVTRTEAQETKDAQRKAELLKQAAEARVQERSVWEEIARDTAGLSKVAALYQIQALK